MIKVKCSSCGNNVRVPAHLAGAEGTCPYCKSPLRIGSEIPRVWPYGWGIMNSIRSEFTKSIGEGAEPVSRSQLFIHDVIEEPLTSYLYAPNLRIRRAQRYKFIPGTWSLLFWVALFHSLIFFPNETILVALGLGADYPAWLMLVMFAGFYGLNGIANSSSTKMYYRYTGIPHDAFIIEYAKAGGFDITHWSPIFAILITYVIFREVIPRVPSFPLQYLVCPYPWLFLVVSVALTAFLAWFGARVIYQARFGNPVGLAISPQKIESLLTNDEIEKALALLRECREDTRLSLDSKSLIDKLMRKAVGIRNEADGDLNIALSLMKEAELLLNRLGDRRTLAVCLFQKAIVIHSMGDLQQAYKINEKAIIVFHNLGEYAFEAKVMANQARLLAIYMHKLRDALPLIEKAYTIAAQYCSREEVRHVKSIFDYIQSMSWSSKFNNHNTRENKNGYST